MHNIIVILGPTAVGKSNLGIEVAKIIDGEIISADSMQVYKNLDIGTAKASKEEMQNIPHHLIDIKNFDEQYNAFEFVNDCTKKIDEIIARDKTPIIVGGTNLYITALIKDYDFSKSKINEKKYKSKYDLNYLIFALNIEPRSELYNRINKRVDVMLNAGLLNEVKMLKERGLDKNSQAGKSIGYRELLSFLENEMTYDEAVEKIKQHSRNFAKRQLTWLRSMDKLIWLDGKDPKNNLEHILYTINKDKSL